MTVERRKKTIEKISPEEKHDLLKSLLHFLTGGKFINVGTCNLERMPNVAPKLVAKVHGDTIFIVDHVMGTTCANLKENPRVSVSFVNEKAFTGYQLNGTATVMEKGEEFDKLAEEFQKIKTDFIVERIMFNVRTGEKASGSPELSLPEKFVVLRIKVIEIVEISSTGHLKSKFSL
jgi:predicted pyridoxine 5'-phosphate oxidase superfamily flavin-nucleotide-binding protein